MVSPPTGRTAVPLPAATRSAADRVRRVARRVRALPGPLISDPRSAPFAREWVSSLFCGRNPLDDQTPWLPFKAREWLRRHVSSDTTVFEYGSGGSTLFFVRHAGTVISVEHDAAWFALVSHALAASGMSNYNHLLREPEALAPGHEELTCLGSRRPEFSDHSFARYVRSIDAYPDLSLDLVLVDGRARLACLDRALPKVRDGGYLLLDNAEREEYAQARTTLARFPRLDLEGLAPYRTYHWRTSIWRIDRSARSATPE